MKNRRNIDPVWKDKQRYNILNLLQSPSPKKKMNKQILTDTIKLLQTKGEPDT